jgi:hypothetical protein
MNVWTLHTPLDYTGIAYDLECSANIINNRFWLQDRQKEWRALPVEMQQEMASTLTFVQSELKGWKLELLKVYSNHMVEFGSGVWITRNVTRPPSKKWGYFTNSDNWTAEAAPGKYIGIKGGYSNHIDGTQRFDRRFRIGDRAEYDSYNLKYIGTITAIGKSTVTITDHKENRRLSLYEFISRNWDYNQKKIDAHNEEEMLCI